MRQVIGAGTILRPGANGELDALTDGVIAIDGAVISYVGSGLDLPAEFAGAERRDFPQSTVLPGLIDSHVHLGFDGSPDPVARMMRESDAEQLVLMLHNARQLLGAGVTTARDLGARSFLDVVVRDAIASGVARGPRLLVANRPITGTGGHCWFMGGVADGPEEIRRMVRLHQRSGADVIKLMATGGFLTPGSGPWTAQFTVVEMSAAVDEAHRLGTPVAAHAHGAEGIARAVAAGVDTIEHCSFVTDPGHPIASPLDAPHRFDPELAAKIADAGIVVCPTVNLKVLEWRSTVKPDWGSHVTGLRDAGVTLIAGTDAGINNTPHSAYLGGLEGLVDLGMTPAEALAAATSRAAVALGLAGVTGALRAGLDADLLVVDGDPLTDIRALRRSRLIMARGHDFTPDVPSPMTTAPNGSM
jgi:imidazolonepropionase-like amidohydrolase